MRATDKENLMITMGMHAGYLLEKGSIELPEGLEGEDILADFVVESVEVYLETKEWQDQPFCWFCDDVLTERFKVPEKVASEPKAESGSTQFQVVATPKTMNSDGLGEELVVYVGTFDECCLKRFQLSNTCTQWSFTIERRIRK